MGLKSFSNNKWQHQLLKTKKSMHIEIESNNRIQSIMDTHLTDLFA